MGFDYPAIFSVVLSVVAAVLIVLAVAGWRALQQWSYAQATTERSAFLKELRAWARVAVNAAEQMMQSSTGEQKLAFVLTQLERLFPDLDEELMRAIIEDAVLQLRLYDAAGE